MENIKIAVCDDQATDRAPLLSLPKAYLEENSIIAQTFEFSLGEELLASDTDDLQLVFMDIYMGGASGMETAKALISRNDRLQVVFTTTSTEFAAEAYEIDALGYIVKPIEKLRLFGVLTRFFDSYFAVRKITVKIGRIDEDIYLSDILYAEAKGKHAVLHTKHGAYEISSSLSELSLLLPASDFFRPIRYAIVSLREITAIPSDVLTLSDGTELPISRGSRESVKQAFSDYKWRKMRSRLAGR